MKLTWPPSEHGGWILETQILKQKTFFFPLHPPDHLLLALRIDSPTPPSSAELITTAADWKAFQIPLTGNQWTYLPFPIEQHAVGSVWKCLEFPIPHLQVTFAYLPWNNRQYRMRALVNEEGHMMFGYRINKNGQVVPYYPPKDGIMYLPEDCYIVPPCYQLKEKSIHLAAAQQEITIKKIPEGRYFGLMKNEDPKYAEENR